MIDTPTLLERFCRYVRIDTEASETRNAAGEYPSSPGQLILGRMLAVELRALGIEDVVHTPKGLVFATIPATVEHDTPVIAWLAHLDTSPETSGKNVNPQIHANYDGSDIVLPGDKTKVLRPREFPDLQAVIGKTIITTDGTTLLGADNKAGIAVIMETVAFLLRHPEIPHGRIRICFTCDEEIGCGVLHLDPVQLGAVVAYTLDGMAQGEIEAETFSADKAVVTIQGINIHPSIAKGKMVNALRLAGKFIDRLPQQTLAPEVTAGREGFLHPYQIDGGVMEVKISFLLRDFVTTKLTEQANLLREIGHQLEREYPEARITVTTREQYRNMADGIAKEPRAVSLAQEATRRAGMEPKMLSIRGGTDGALLTAKGVPTPNLSTAEHNPHSPLEWTCLEEMQSAVRVLVELAQVWASVEA